MFINISVLVLYTEMADIKYNIDQTNTQSLLDNVNVNIVDFLDIKSIDDFTSTFAPTTNRRKGYLCLDTLYARYLDNNTRLQWDFVDTLTEGPNSANMECKIRDIVSIRMLSTVIPKFSSISQRASIAIDEFNTQAYILPNGRKFHWLTSLLNVATNNQSGSELTFSTIALSTTFDFTLVNKYQLVSDHSFNDGYYKFNKPITTIDTITISIGDPYDVIQLPQYQYTDVPISFAPGTMTLTFPAVPLVPGAPIYNPNNFLDPNVLFTTSIFISDFTTDQPDADAIWISTINQYEFTNITTLPSNIITLQTNQCYKSGATGYPFSPPTGVVILPTNGLPPPIGNLSKVTVVFNSNRIVFNFELEYSL